MLIQKYKYLIGTQLIIICIRIYDNYNLNKDKTVFSQNLMDIQPNNICRYISSDMDRYSLMLENIVGVLLLAFIFSKY